MSFFCLIIRPLVTILAFDASSLEVLVYRPLSRIARRDSQRARLAIEGRLLLAGRSVSQRNVTLFGFTLRRSFAAFHGLLFWFELKSKGMLWESALSL